MCVCVCEREREREMTDEMHTIFLFLETTMTIDLFYFVVFPLLLLLPTNRQLSHKYIARLPVLSRVMLQFVVTKDTTYMYIYVHLSSQKLYKLIPVNYRLGWMDGLMGVVVPHTHTHAHTRTITRTHNHTPKSRNVLLVCVTALLCVFFKVHVVCFIRFRNVFVRPLSVLSRCFFAQVFVFVCMPFSPHVVM